MALVSLEGFLIAIIQYHHAIHTIAQYSNKKTKSFTITSTSSRYQTHDDSANVGSREAEK